MSDAIELFREALRAALGYAPDVIEPGKLHRFPTSDRRGDDAGWSKLFVDLRGGVFGCNRSGESHTWSAIDRHSMTMAERAALARQIAQATRERAAAQREAWAMNAKRNAALWARCVTVAPGDPVHTYLCRRLALDDFAVPRCLRLHPTLDYWHGDERIGTFPAMVAPLIAPEGRVVALHRTYLTDDGRKADVPKAKKVTCVAGPLTGASIRLQQPARGVLGIAEGIETALAASLASGVPTVAAYSANNVAAYQWPTGVQRLVIFADHDAAGRDAADKLKARAVRAWLRVDVLTPTESGADWCSVWAQRGAMVMESAA